MDNQITCPNCGKAIPLTEALSRQVQEKYQKFYKIRLSEEKAKLESALKESISREIAEKMSLDLKDKANEALELKKRNNLLEEQVLDQNKILRQLKTDMESSKLEMEKRLLSDQEKIRLEEKKRIEEEYKFRILEKEKQLDDARKIADEYKRKLEQGSVQLQGEVLELEIENTLRKIFQNDEIREVPKGIKGADVLQVVKNAYGKVCGIIVWESKRTKNWSDGWISKLKEDQRELKADVAVIISQTLPEEVRNFNFVNGIWISDFESFTGLATALRRTLIEVASVRLSNKNRENKMAVLYEYFCGLEFKQRLEGMLEPYRQMQEDLEKEKRWFVSKWAKEEKNMRCVLDNLAGIYGDLQGIIGKSLPEVRGLEMLPEPIQEEII